MGFLDGLRVLGPEAEPRDDVAVDAEALLLDVAGQAKGTARHIEEDKEEEILKCGQCREARQDFERDMNCYPSKCCFSDNF